MAVFWKWGNVGWGGGCLACNTAKSNRTSSVSVRLVPGMHLISQCSGAFLVSPGHRIAKAEGATSSAAPPLSARFNFHSSRNLTSFRNCHTFWVVRRMQHKFCSTGKFQTVPEVPRPQLGGSNTHKLWTEGMRERLSRSTWTSLRSIFLRSLSVRELNCWILSMPCCKMLSHCQCLDKGRRVCELLCEPAWSKECTRPDMVWREHRCGVLTSLNFRSANERPSNSRNSSRLCPSLAISLFPLPPAPLLLREELKTLKK